MSEERAVYDGVRVPIHTCCERCWQLTDQQINALLATGIRVGQVCYTALGQVTPGSLDRALTRREREILVALLIQHPQVAMFSALGDPQRPGQVNLLGIAALVSNLNARLEPYHVRVVRKQQRGYYLVALHAL